jgi:hypothetical protein
MFHRQTRRPKAGGFLISTTCGILLAAAAGGAGLSCDGDRPVETTKVTRNPVRPISEVLKEHAPRLMSLEGVVGVYEGALDDGKACIVVMLKTEKPVRRTDIPRDLEGYTVRLEFGGEVKPMR